MTRKIVNIVILAPLAILLIVLSVANRGWIRLALNPFNPDDKVLSISAPLFIFLFVALIAGMLIGSFATWLNQGKYRKRARAHARAAVRWQAEADKQKRVNEVSRREIVTTTPS